MVPPLNLPQPLENLVYRTLDHWDDIVLMLHRQGDGINGLIFHEANRPFCRASGYGDAELKGHGIGLLAGPGADRTPFTALADAARDGRSAQLELPCTGKTGRAFWFGLHLMPVPDTADLFVVLGRDITEAMQARRRQAEIQGLLAKVFLSVDAAVAIVGSDGRFLMTNPALDRFLGYPPNGLVGHSTLDVIAPEAHAVVSAERERQLQDGKDYTAEVPLVRVDGTLVPSHLHAVLIDTIDRRKFRIVTARPLSTPSRTTAPTRPVLAGKIRLVGLEDVKAALGDRWPATAQRAMASAEQIVRRRLGPRDTFSRTADSGFIVCFGDAGEAEAAFRAATIARDIRHHLIGSGETAGTAYVNAITATVQVPEGTEAAGPHLSALLSKDLGNRLGAIEAEARARLRTTLDGLRCDLEPIHGRNPEQTWGAFVGLPKAAEQEIAVALTALPLGEAQELDLDATLLDLAAEQAASNLSLHKSQPLLVEVNFAIFEARTHTERYVAACRLVDPRLRQRLVMVLTNMPASTPRSRLLDCITRLRPFCSMVALAIDRPDAAPPDLSLSGSPLLVLDATTPGQLPPAELSKLLGRLHIGRAQLLVRRVANWTDAAMLLASGVDLVSVVANR